MTALLLLLALAPVEAGQFAITVSGQRATLEATDAPLPEILEALAAEARLDVDYPPAAPRPQVTIQIPEAPLQEAIERLLDAAGVEHEIESEDGQVTSVRVIVRSKSPREWVEEGGSLEGERKGPAELPEGMTFSNPGAANKPGAAGAPEPPRPSRRSPISPGVARPG